MPAGQAATALLEHHQHHYNSSIRVLPQPSLQLVADRHQQLRFLLQLQPAYVLWLAPGLPCGEHRVQDRMRTQLLTTVHRRTIHSPTFSSTTTSSPFAWLQKLTTQLGQLGLQHADQAARICCS